MSKWVVCVNKTYYPEVTEFDEYKEALESFKVEQEYHKESDATVYLCEVKERTEYIDK